MPTVGASITHNKGNRHLPSKYRVSASASFPLRTTPQPVLPIYTLDELHRVTHNQSFDGGRRDPAMAVPLSPAVVDARPHLRFARAVPTSPIAKNPLSRRSARAIRIMYVPYR